VNCQPMAFLADCGKLWFGTYLRRAGVYQYR